MMTKRNHRRRTTTPTDNHRSSSQSDQPAVLPVIHHIRELRRRLFLSILLGLVVGGVTYNYHDFFIKLVMAPLGEEKLVYLNPAGGFNFIFMVTFYATMLIMTPFLLYQVYAFIRPAIPQHTRLLSVSVALVAAALMAAGAVFAYIVVVPAGLHFLTNFASDYVIPTLTADSYLRFVLGYIFGVALLFEVPLLLLFWHWISPMTPKGLLKSERFVVVGAFVCAAVISPSPDALTQTIIAVPIILVYQFGVIAVLISIRRQRKTHDKTVYVNSSRLEQENAPQDHSPRVATRPIVTRSVGQEMHRRPSPVASSRVSSVDGIIKARQVLPASRMPTAAIPQKPLEAAPRSRLINDFAVPGRS